MAKSQSATVALKTGMAFQATTGSGYTIPLDADELVGGKEQGPRPLEMLLVGLGGCTGMDVISILRKMRQDVTDYQIQVVGNRSDEHPKVYTDIIVEHVVKGKNLSEEMVRKAVDLSANRYCPASAMLVKAASVVHTYRIVDVDSGAEQIGKL